MILIVDTDDVDTVKANLEEVEMKLYAVVIIVAGGSCCH